MKSRIAALIIIALTFSSSIFASNFGTISEETQNQWQEQRVHELVGRSSDYRASINKGRSIAGQTQDELKWANEYESLMNSNDNTDYLELALKL